MNNTYIKVARDNATISAHANNVVKRRSKIARYIATFLVIASSLFVPVAAHASDWEEYAVVCVSFGFGEKKSKIIFTTKEGEEYLEIKDKIENRWVLAVNQFIDKGWQPLGGLSVSIAGVCQAMVKD